VGELTIGLRRGEKRLDPKDAAVLRPLAASLAVSVQATHYAADLQDARQSLVAAREAERSRLRRDLHDGLGPVLTGVQLKADAARRMADTDPAQATALMDQIRAQTTEAIGEVRRIVRDLRPPSLDTLGLIPAIRQHADTLHPLRVRLDCPDPMPPLPAALDVALYRIATEALTNIVRHAPTATTATVELTHSADRLTLTVADNAVNGTQPWAPGVGLTSMTARAAELGGRLTATPTPAGGRVEASLPCGRSPR
jgi:signal transduction histidine kinase